MRLAYACLGYLGLCFSFPGFFLISVLVFSAIHLYQGPYHGPYLYCIFRVSFTFLVLFARSIFLPYHGWPMIFLEQTDRILHHVFAFV